VHKIVLVTSGQPSLNPRLVKEADALSAAGYKVTVIYAYWNNWGADFDKQLLAKKNWNALCTGGDPVHKRTSYFFSRIVNKSALVFRRYTGINILIDLAASRASYFLIREAKKHKADLYIGHNLGALPAVVAAAKAYGKPCGFDAEDLHRYEISNDINHVDVKLKTEIEDHYLPQLNYFTTSSPQIAEIYKQLYPGLNPTVLLNVFPKTTIDITAKAHHRPVKLFWFSQTIGPNRGLQDAINALRLLDKADFEFHILGSRQPGNEAFISGLQNSGGNIFLHASVHPDELTAFASQFDIGLALEPGFSINNNLALSNKIFTYMQAGLAIVASDTEAQEYLITKNPATGKIYPKGDAEALASILSNYQHNRNLLSTTQQAALQLAHDKYNWDIESQKFIKVVKDTLEHA